MEFGRVLFRSRPARADDGRVTGWYGTGFDVDVFRRTDAALHESERSLRELLETAPALIWCMTPSGRPIYFSRHMREFLGFDVAAKDEPDVPRSEEHTSELQSLMRLSSAVLCWKNKT